MSEQEEPQPQQQQPEPEQGGLGIVVAPMMEGLLVTVCVDGGPASQSGLLAGDLIRSIDGNSGPFKRVQDAAALLTGPIGTSVVIGFLRQGVGEMQTTAIRGRVPDIRSYHQSQNRPRYLMEEVILEEEEEYDRSTASQSSPELGGRNSTGIAGRRRTQSSSSSTSISNVISPALFPPPPQQQQQKQRSPSSAASGERGSREETNNLILGDDNATENVNFNNNQVTPVDESQATTKQTKETFDSTANIANQSQGVTVTSSSSFSNNNNQIQIQQQQHHHQQQQQTISANNTNLEASSLHLLQRLSDVVSEMRAARGRVEQSTTLCEEGAEQAAIAMQARIAKLEETVRKQREQIESYERTLNITRKALEESQNNNQQLSQTVVDLQSKIEALGGEFV